MNELTRAVEIIGQGGWLAVSAFLAYLLYRLEKAVKGFQQDTRAEIIRVHERIDNVETRFLSRDEHAEYMRRLNIIESDYHSKEAFYRDMGGWRQEIRDIREEIRELCSRQDSFIKGINERLDKVILRG